MSAPVIAATYARVSTRMQGRHGFSLGNQDQTLEEFVAAKGWVLPVSLKFRDGEDENASGADWDLPELTRMLAAARNGEFEVLVVPDLDRFARSLVKGLVLEEQLRKHGVRIVYQRVPVEDSPEGQLLKTQLFAFAEYERQKTLLRTMTGKRAKAQSGQVVGMGRPPYGYRFTHSVLPSGKKRVCGLEPDPLTSPVVKRIFDLLKHRSTAETAALLNTDGILGPRGKSWTADVIYDIASHRVYMGEWCYGRNHRKVGPDDPSVVVVAVPAIVDRAAWDEAQRAFVRRRTVRRGRLTGNDDLYLLRGMLTCGHCGGALQTHLNSGVRYYRCGCRWPSKAAQRGKPACVLADVHAAGLEGELWRILDETLLDPSFLAMGLSAGIAEHEAADSIRQERLDSIDAEIARQRRRLQGYVSDMGDLPEGELRASVRKQALDIEGIVGRLNAERAELAGVRSKGLSPDEAASIQQLADEVRTGLALATTVERRQLIERLEIRGAILLDQEYGIQLSRNRKNLFRIAWNARVPLKDSAGQLNNWVIHKIADAGVITTLQRSVGGVDDSLWRRLPNLAPGQAIVTFTHMHRPVLTAIDPTPAKLRMVD